MRKKLMLLLLFIMLIPLNANATSGALRKASIKQCPDGNYYGNHSSNGTIHWHLAERHPEMNSGWAAVGEPLSGDPCARSSNVTTTTTTKAPVTTTKSVTTSQARTNGTITTTLTTNITTQEVTTTELITTSSVPENKTTTTKAVDEENREDNPVINVIASVIGACFMLSVPIGIGAAVYFSQRKK